MIIRPCRGWHKPGEDGGGGCQDRRLPNAKELQGILDYARPPDPAASAASGEGSGSASPPSRVPVAALTLSGPGVD